MVRRLQLLEPEHRSSGQLVALGNRIRDGLLRGNKVIPAVLGVLALLIFAWVIAGALTGGSNDQGGQQASNQGSVSQTPEQGSDSGSSGTPAPEAENRDADSYSAFKAKDPFREIVPPARETTTKESTRESTASGNGSRGSNSRSGSSRDSNSRSGGGTGGSSENNDEDFIDQTSPGNSSRGAGGGGSRDTGGDGSGGSADQDGGAGQGGNDNLFNSGGDLMP